MMFLDWEFFCVNLFNFVFYINVFFLIFLCNVRTAVIAVCCANSSIELHKLNTELQTAKILSQTKLSKGCKKKKNIAKNMCKTKIILQL